jgi:hypothetical protein
MPSVTKEQEELVLEDIKQAMMGRFKEGTLDTEADFLAGAAVAMTRMTGGVTRNEIWGPAGGWYMYMVGGRSVLALFYEDAGDEVMAKEAQRQHDRRSLIQHKGEDLIQFTRLVRNTLKPHYRTGSNAIDGLYYRATDLLVKMQDISPEEIDLLDLD